MRKPACIEAKPIGIAVRDLAAAIRKDEDDCGIGRSAPRAPLPAPSPMRAGTRIDPAVAWGLTRHPSQARFLAIRGMNDMKKPGFRPPSKPAPVADSWAKIGAWLGKHLPAVKASLRPGISREDLAAFEEAIGRPLPEDVRESCRIHDGQRPISGGAYGGVIFGQALCPLLDGADSMTRKSVLSEWRHWAEIRADFAKDPDDLALMRRDCASVSAEAIHCDYTNAGWIPLYSEEGYAASFGVDLDPGPRGVTGQVINFGRDDRKKYVLAWSWKQLLHEVAVELEAGNFAVNDGSGVRGGGSFKVFQLKRPAVKNFCGLYPEWSAAKAGPEGR